VDKLSNEAEKPPESQQGTSQGHPVRSDFPIVKTQVVFFWRKISTFGGKPPFLTIWILAF
jgi:hypothetical protein